MILDPLGNLYGVATTGGTYGQGVVFKLAHMTNGSWEFRTLYAFQGQPDAGFPYGALVFDKKGNLYGTSYDGGTVNLGAVYQLTPQRGGDWRESVLYSFKGDSDGN